VLTELGLAAPLRESHRIRLDDNLTFLEDAMGACERLLRIPIPLSYTR
jgi:predicted membrane chloride channel (bestrophin family)